MTECITVTKNIPVCGNYDVIVAGGGVAGVAAALSAAREGKKVILMEKTINLGGLATIGLINLFVPMCNGHGVQIIKGMADEFLHMSRKYGWDNMPDEWKNGDPGEKAKTRLICKYSANILIWQFTELLHNAGVDLLFDTIVSMPKMDGGHCSGLIVENKSGTQYYTADVIIDTTGDCDVLYRAGVPTVQGKNYHTYISFAANINSCKEAAEKENIGKIYRWVNGGKADLYGRNHPENIKHYSGTDVKDISRYVVTNQIEALESIKNDKRFDRDVITVPTMPQFRTTRHLDGNHTFSADDAYKHFDDSISAICDFDRKDYLYEVPYGTLVKDGFDNLITAGRSASAEGYGWDVLRVIPPAIVTGQAAGLAACQSIDTKTPIYKIDVKNLQAKLESQNVMIHFDDKLIPDDMENAGEKFDIGHV